MPSVQSTVDDAESDQFWAKPKLITLNQMIAILNEYLCKIKHVIESYLGFGQSG